MKKHGMSFRIKRLTVVLGAAVLLVWGLFYFHTAMSMKRSSEQHMRQVSRQIISRLEVELLELENLSYTLSHHDSIHNLLNETEVLAYYEKTGAVDNLIDTLNTSTGFADSLVLSGGDGVSTCFGTMLGTTALRIIDSEFKGTELPRYAPVYIENVRYICHARGIDGQNEAGTLYLLLREDKLLGLFGEYISDGNIWIGLAENNKAVISANPERLGLEGAGLGREFALHLRQNVGASPFEIWVGVEKDYIAQTSFDYRLAVFITAALFILLLVFYLLIANRHFFRPMVSVINDVEGMDSVSPDSRLSYTGNDSFDSLVKQINLMLRRLEEHSSALIAARSALDQTEIERQRTLIISLKKQISAHFTINILNIIKVLAGQGKTDEAAKMADGLSHMLRHTNDEDEFCSGMDALYVLEKYITIMEIRYPGRFKAEFFWDDRLIHAKIPRMLIQPLVENAIMHGLSEISEGGIVEIRGLLNGETALFSVEDNGKGMSEKELEQLRAEVSEANAPVWNVGGTERIALANIQRRIWTYYGSQGELSIISEAGKGTKVLLSIPAWPPGPV